MTQQLPQIPPADAAEPELTEVRNFRDVGGLPTSDGRAVRPGRLFRSGHLAHATEDDAAFLSSLGLHTVFDFRNEADRKVEGADVDLPGVRNVHIPLNDPADGKGSGSWCATARSRSCGRSSATARRPPGCPSRTGR